MTAEHFASAAEEAYAQRNEIDALDEVEFVTDPDVRSVISVQFSRGELERIEQAAQKTAMSLATYIRIATLAASAVDAGE